MKLTVFFKFLKLSKKQMHAIDRISPDCFDQYDQKCLALGMWEMFKAVHIPSFLIGMDSDAESLLHQYILEAYPEFNEVVQTKRKIELAHSLVVRSKNIYKFFAETGFYVKPGFAKEPTLQSNPQ